MSKCPKLLLFVTEDWYFCSHRLELAIALKEVGYDVVVVTRVNRYGDRIRSSGLKLIPFEITRRGANPIKELISIMRLISIYRKEKPDIVHHVALKPVIYGTISSLVAGKPLIVNALAGLGILYSSQSVKLRILKSIIQVIFRVLLNRKKSKLILQNPDDVQMLTNNHTINEERIVLIRGSGVDTEKYKLSPEPSGMPIVTLASRMLWEKGVGEFVEAAIIFKRKGIAAKFVLVGSGDQENPSSITNAQLQEWQDEGIVEWWGHRDDMPGVFAQSNIVCLPSYYGEGVPKVLIEAASCGRPIVTTDMPGCREIVKDSVNGILVPPRNANAVADAIEKLIKSPKIRKQMGEKGRELVEQDFSVQKIISETIQVYKELSN